MASSNDEGTKTPTFMDRFALHLAKELVGSKTVLDVLKQHLPPDGGDRSIEFGNRRSKDTPLYWRSDLFLEDPADMVDASKWPCSYNNNKDKDNSSSDGDGDGNKQHLMYLDAKFEFCNDKAAKTKKRKKQIKTTWGCFVLHSSGGQEDTTQHHYHHHHHHHKYKNYGLYYKSKPMALSWLEKHVESMDIDLPEQPQNMAKFMKPALQVLVTKPKNSKGKNIFPNAKAKKNTKEEFPIQLKNASILPSENEKKHNMSIKLELYYEELNDRGVLTLELEEQSSSPYNALGMEPFYLREIMSSTPSNVVETNIPASRISGQQGLVGSSIPFGSQTPAMSQNSFASPATNGNATPSPEKNNNLVDLQLDQSLDEWFRLDTNDDDDDDDDSDSQKQDKGKKNSVAAAAAMPSPSGIVNNNKKKRPPPKNLQNHGMRKIKKKKKKGGGLFG
ncbi:MAG: hypothetical protein SGBAC_002537 [Bacillariaceae sp.]